MKPPTQARPAHDPDAILAKAALSAARYLGLSNRELARILGTSEASVSRLHRQRALRRGSRESELAALFVRLFRSLDTLVGGDREKARSWLRASNRHLGAAPIRLLTATQGLVHVAEYLDAMRGTL